MPRGTPVQWQPPDISHAGSDDLYPVDFLTAIIAEHLFKVGSDAMRGKATKKLQGVLGVMRIGFMQHSKPAERDQKAAAARVEAKVTQALDAINKLDRSTLRLLQDAAGKDRHAPTRRHVDVYNVGKLQVADRHGPAVVADVVEQMRAVRRWSRHAQRGLAQKGNAGRPERVIERHAVEQLMKLWRLTSRNRPKPLEGDEAEFPKFLAFVNATLSKMLEAFDAESSVVAIAREVFSVPPIKSVRACTD
ncbi:hypothetical protein [Lichenihabitans psoromatis]|uniref:hypothetical protein n=1 Tax=Lichenihabitans psoromatis TaxID=2528642 RepID=UPI0010383855|nr:hypothetical protein [Lichenihabitans psoromatis]